MIIVFQMRGAREFSVRVMPWRGPRCLCERGEMDVMSRFSVMSRVGTESKLCTVQRVD